MKRLTRSKNDVMIAGVCGGIGEYFNIDPTLIRVIFLGFIVLGGVRIIVYPILWLIIPREVSNYTAARHSDADFKDKN